MAFLATYALATLNTTTMICKHQKQVADQSISFCVDNTNGNSVLSGASVNQSIQFPYASAVYDTVSAVFIGVSTFYNVFLNASVTQQTAAFFSLSSDFGSQIAIQRSYLSVNLTVSTASSPWSNASRGS